MLNGQKYFYEVVAVNFPYGAGSDSNEVFSTPRTVPGPPLVLSATAGNTQVILNWNTPTSNGGSAITGYKVYRGTVSNGEVLLATIGNLTTYTATGLTNSQIYYFKVAAVNVAGIGAYSNEASATPATVPGAPTGLTPTAGNTQVALAWTAPASNGGASISGYKVYVGTSSGGEKLNTTLSAVLAYTVTNLKNGQHYYFEVAAVNVMGTGANSTETSAMPVGPPGAPQSLTATSGNLQVVLNWTAPSNNYGSAITGYNIYQGTASNGEIYLESTGNVTSFRSTGLTNGQEYYFKVSAVNGVGEGALSAESSATPAPTVPSAPRNLVVTAGNGMISLTWTPPATNGGDPILNYTVHLGSAPGEEIEPILIENVTNFTQTNLNNGQIFYYVVTATNAIGEGPRSNEASGIPNGPPESMPGNFAFVTGNASVLLSWTPPAQNGGAPITGYNLYRGLVWNDIEFYQSLGNVTSFNDTGLTDGQSYYYQISSVNVNGEGPLTFYVNATPVFTPSAPRNVIPTAGDQQISLFWQAPASNGGIAITNYNIYIGTVSNGEVLNATVGNITSTVITGFTNGLTYYIKISAVNGKGEGPLSAEVALSLTTAVFISTPSNVLYVAGMTGNSISWTITCKVPPATYSVFRNGTSVQAGSWVSGVPFSIDVDGLTPGVYNYTIIASNGLGNSSSDLVWVTVRAGSNVQVTGLSCRTGNGTYVAGMSFVVRVSLANTGGTAVTGITASLSFGGYAGLTANGSATINLQAGGTGWIDFSILTSAGCVTNSSVNVYATWAGTEAISGLPKDGMQGSHVLVLDVKASASISITSLTVHPTNSNNTYVAGEQFTSYAVVANTATAGSAKAVSVMITLAFGGYSDLTAAASSPVSIAADSILNISIVVTVAAAAITSSVTITATATGNMEISNAALTQATNMVGVSIKSTAQLGITSFTVHPTNGNETYVAGETFTVSVVVANTAATGAAKAVNVVVALTFGGYAGLSAVASSPISIAAHSNQNVSILVRVLDPATTSAVMITATATGNMEISDAALTQATSIVSVSIKATALLSIASLTVHPGNSTYIGGQTFIVYTVVSNTAESGAAKAVNVVVILTFGSYTGLSAVASSPISIAAGSNLNISIVVTIAAGAATSGVTITSTATGNMEISNAALIAVTNTVTVNIKQVAALSITSVTQPGNGTYVGGMTFTVTTTVQNTAVAGGAKAINVVVTLTLGAGLSASPSAAITIPAGSITPIAIVVTVAASAATATGVQVTANVAGNVEITNTPLAAGPSSIAGGVGIKQVASLSITGVTQSGNGTYVGGMTFTVTTTVQNTALAGGAKAINVVVTLALGTGLSASPSAAITIPAGSSTPIAILVTVAAGAATATGVQVSANVAGNIEISNALLSAGPSSIAGGVSIKAQAGLLISAMTNSPSAPYYTAGTWFVVQVTIENTAPSGGAKALNVSVSLTFGGYPMSMANASRIATILPTAATSFYINVSINLDAASNATVRIHATTAGVEEISARPLSAGPSQLLVIVTAAAGPSAPQNFGAIPGNAKVRLVWQVPLTNGGLPITGYRVYRGFASNDESLLIIVGNVTSYNDTTVTNGKSYYYSMAAVNRFGTGANSTISTPVKPVTTPGAPRNVTPSVADHEVQLAWLVPSSNGGLPIKYYNIYRGTASGTEVLYQQDIGNTTTYLDTGLINGVTYYYTVAAVNSNGTGNHSVEVSAMPIAIPTAPQWIGAKTLDSLINVTWAMPDDNGGHPVLGYVIYRGTFAGGESFLASIGNVTSYNDTHIVIGTMYYYQVAAINSYGDGMKSSEVSAIAATLPGAPANFTALLGNKQVTLSWNAPANVGGSGAITYIIYRGTVSGGEVLVNSTGNVTHFVDTGLVNGIPLYYQISAVNIVGEGAKAPEVHVTPATTASVPRDLSVVTQGGQVILNWTAPAVDGGAVVIGYCIYRGVMPDTKVLLATVGNVTSYIDKKVSTGTSYYYSITAINAAGQSQETQTLGIVVTAPATSNATVVAIVVSIVGGGAIVVIALVLTSRRKKMLAHGGLIAGKGRSVRGTVQGKFRDRRRATMIKKFRESYK